MKLQPRTMTVLVGLALAVCTQGLAESPKNPQGSITNLTAVVSGPEPTGLAGRKMEITGAKIQKIVNPRLLLVGPDPGHTFLLRLPERTKSFNQGSIIDFWGVVNQMPIQLQAWNLDESLSKDIHGKLIFCNVVKASLHISR
jgi:hypothetical protein